MTPWRSPFSRVDRRGFTLIEMLTVCAIIGILVAMAIASVTKARIQAREAKAVAMVKSFTNAYTNFLAREGEYPHWGPGQRYATMADLWADLTARDYLPSDWSYFQPAATDLAIRGPIDGFVIEIKPFEQDAANLRSTDNYFAIIFRPYGFQDRYIGLSVDPATDRISPIPLWGENADITTYSVHPIPDF